jgi:hypothetical protein
MTSGPRVPRVTVAARATQFTTAAANVLTNRSGFFICYRRRDSAGVAGRIRDRLVAEFGKEHVFFDVDDIRPGANFVQAITERVGKVAVVLIVIGRVWRVDPKASTTMQKANPTDIVRLEAATALASHATVLPIVVDGGKVPSAEELPPKLKQLAYINAVEITHHRFDEDIERLFEYLRPISGIKKRGWLLGIGVAVTVVVVVALWFASRLVAGA